MMLVAFDQSVRGFAYAAAPTDWTGWSDVRTARCDGGKLSRAATAAQLGARQDKLFRFAYVAVVQEEAALVGFESYAYSARPNVEVVELVGAIKHRLRDLSIPYETIQQSSWRAALGKVKRGAEKETVKSLLQAAGAPVTLSDDEYDALGVLNLMLVNHGGRPLAEKQ